MFKDDKYWSLFKYWKNYKPEEELYVRLKENPVWPFKEIGDGYYYVSFRSDRVEYGIGILLLCILSLIVVLAVVGPFSLAFAVFLFVFGMGCWTLHGKMAWRELIISRRGKGKYMLRIFQNEEILFQSEIRNVYVRLTRKIDALGDPYFCLVLGGFEMDDHRITRMTKAEEPLRVLGMRIAYRVGVNFFDWKDESEEHLVWHYKNFSKLKYKSRTQVVIQRSTTNLDDRVSLEGADSEIAAVDSETFMDDDDKNPRKVRINKFVRVRPM